MPKETETARDVADDETKCRVHLGPPPPTLCSTALRPPSGGSDERLQISCPHHARVTDTVAKCLSPTEGGCSCSDGSSLHLQQTSGNSHVTARYRSGRSRVVQSHQLPELDSESFKVGIKEPFYRIWRQVSVSVRPPRFSLRYRSTAVEYSVTLRASV